MNWLKDHANENSIAMVSGNVCVQLRHDPEVEGAESAPEWDFLVWQIDKKKIVTHIHYEHHHSEEEAKARAERYICTTFPDFGDGIADTSAVRWLTPGTIPPAKPAYWDGRSTGFDHNAPTDVISIDPNTGIGTTVTRAEYRELAPFDEDSTAPYKRKG